MEKMRERVTSYHNQNSQAEVLDKREIFGKALQLDKVKEYERKNYDRAILTNGWWEYVRYHEICENIDFEKIYIRFIRIYRWINTYIFCCFRKSLENYCDYFTFYNISNVYYKNIVIVKEMNYSSKWFAKNKMQYLF